MLRGVVSWPMRTSRPSVPAASSIGRNVWMNRGGLRKKSSLYSTVSLVSLLASTLPACRGARRVEFPQESASSFRFSPPPPPR